MNTLYNHFPDLSNTLYMGYKVPYRPQKPPTEKNVWYSFTLTGVKRAKNTVFDRHPSPIGECGSKVLRFFIGQPNRTGKGYLYV